MSGSHRATLDQLVRGLRRGQGEHVLDEHPGEVDVVRRQRADRHHLFGFEHGHRPGHRHRQVEVARGGVEPGVALGVGDSAPAGTQLDVRDARNFTRYNNRMALTGTLAGFRPGPQIGSEVKGQNGVTVIAFAQEKKG